MPIIPLADILREPARAGHPDDEPWVEPWHKNLWSTQPPNGQLVEPIPLDTTLRIREPTYQPAESRLMTPLLSPEAAVTEALTNAVKGFQDWMRGVPRPGTAPPSRLVPDLPPVRNISTGGSQEPQDGVQAGAPAQPARGSIIQVPGPGVPVPMPAPTLPRPEIAPTQQEEARQLMEALRLAGVDVGAGQYDQFQEMVQRYIEGTPSAGEGDTLPPSWWNTPGGVPGDVPMLRTIRPPGTPVPMPQADPDWNKRYSWGPA